MPGRQRSAPTVWELFAGAGFLSYAFLREGFTIAGAVEIDPTAAKTYEANIGKHVTLADVRAFSPKGRCDVLCLGSPCQSYSTLGKRDPNDPRHRLILEVVRWARILKPKIIVIENVPAVLNHRVWKVVAKKLNDLGYDVAPTVLDAVNFGAPQRRVRSFTFGSVASLPNVNTHAIAQVAMTVREAWQDLPIRANGINHHYAPTPSELALARMRVIPPGGDKRDIMRLAPHLAAPSWWRLPAEITDIWGRMKWDEPSNTIRTALQNPSKGRYIHPEQNRVISLREAARLQTVPDEWIFVGLPTQVARQIGNGVPISLGRAVARAIYAAL